MVFAAGLGTRLRPLTDMMPKALVRIGGKPLLAHVLEKLHDSGFGRVVVNVHHFPQQIITYLLQHPIAGMDIRISDESEQLLETGGGLRKATALFDHDSHVLIHNVDILSNVALNSFYEKALANDATLLVSQRKTNRYLLFNDEMRLVGWTNLATGEVRSPYPHLEVDACHHYAFSGIHVISPQLITMMADWPDRFGIIDFYLSICDKVNIHGHVEEHLRLMDVGKMETIADAEDFLRELSLS